MLQEIHISKQQSKSNKISAQNIDVIISNDETKINKGVIDIGQIQRKNNTKFPERNPTGDITHLFQVGSNDFENSGGDERDLQERTETQPNLVRRSQAELSETQNSKDI